MPSSNERELLKQVMGEILKKGGVEIVRFILFGSRARGNFTSSSDWDVMVITRQGFSVEEKMYYSKRIREKLAQLGIDGDVLLKSESEVERDKEIPGTITREAMKGGVPL